MAALVGSPDLVVSDALPLLIPQRAKTEQFSDRGFGHLMRGVVHVGAHEGQEIPWYLHKGHVPVWAFEPNPEPAARLRAAYHSSQVEVTEIALGDETGRREFWIPRHLHDGSDDEQSASFLRADRDSGYAWGDRDREGRSIPIESYRFDDAYAAIWPGLRDAFTTLVVDVQGFELQVLKGFGDFLGDFYFLNIECSAVPIYEGGAFAQEVVAYLLDHGFEQDSPIQSHDDIMFIRRGL